MDDLEKRVERLENVMLTMHDTLVEGFNRMERAIDRNTDQIILLHQRVDGVQQEVKGLNQRIDGLNDRVDNLSLQQQATHRTLQDLAQEVERIADKIDFDGVTYDTRVILETDPATGFTTIRRYRNAA